MSEDIRELLAAAPFRPFTIEMLMEYSFEITDPRQVTVPPHGESLHYRARGGEVRIFAIRHIISLRVREALV